MNRQILFLYFRKLLRRNFSGFTVVVSTSIRTCNKSWEIFLLFNRSLPTFVLVFISSRFNDKKGKKRMEKVSLYFFFWVFRQRPRTKKQKGRKTFIVTATVDYKIKSFEKRVVGDKSFFSLFRSTSTEVKGLFRERKSLLKAIHQLINPLRGC
jgi:hypothetical protein